MLRRKIAFPMLALAAILVSLPATGSDSKARASSVTSELVYHSLIPLGSESFSVQEWNSNLTVVVSAENAHFEGWRRVDDGERTRLLDAAGRQVRSYPDHVDFRVALGTRTRLPNDKPFPLRSAVPLNDYLLNVSFRLKIFHGLRETIVPAASAVMIGVPADIPYEERIYRVSFDLGEVPMSDRVVLEVLAPGGERLCKFHLDLN